MIIRNPGLLIIKECPFCAVSAGEGQTLHNATFPKDPIFGVRRKHDMLDFTPRDNVEFVCMYGYDTNLVQDVERFRFLRSLPGAYVFVEPYRPPAGGKPANLAKFLDERAAFLIAVIVITGGAPF